MTLHPGMPRVTVAVPSYNQGRFLEATLRSIFAQPVAMEVMLADAGSTDGTLHVIKRWQDRLTWVRRGPDKGQASAINEAINHGRAPLVCWLNSDDLFLADGLSTLVQAIEADASIAVAYGGCLRLDEQGRMIGRHQVAPFTARGLARRCIIAQPASIIRREAWERVGGLDENLHLSLDYDLWWRLHWARSRFAHIDGEVAAVRFHPATKTVKQASEMYAEAKLTVRRHHGSVPLVWWLRQPLSIGMRRSRVLGNMVQAGQRWLERIRGGSVVHEHGLVRSGRSRTAVTELREIRRELPMLHTRHAE